MDEFMHLAEQGEEVENLQRVQKCNKKRLIDKILGLSDLPISKRELVMTKTEVLIEMLQQLEVPDSELIQDLVASNKFPPAIVDIAIEKQYTPSELYGLMKRIRAQQMSHKTILQTFRQLEKGQMHELLYEKPDLVYVLNCKYERGCVTFSDIQECLS
jgi:hypothetical protein